MIKTLGVHFERVRRKVFHTIMDRSWVLDKRNLSLLGLLLGIAGAYLASISIFESPDVWLEAPDGKKYYAQFVELPLARIAAFIIALGFALQLVEKLLEFENRRLNNLLSFISIAANAAMLWLFFVV